jgi:hypothetical protein
MARKTILIAGESLELLNQSIPGMEVHPLCGTLVRVSFPTDTEQGAAWERAIERYAADLINTVQPLDIQVRKDAAFARIAKELKEAKRKSGV